jgi:hypothetical protein
MIETRESQGGARWAHRNVVRSVDLQDRRRGGWGSAGSAGAAPGFAAVALPGARRPNATGACLPGPAPGSRSSQTRTKALGPKDHFFREPTGYRRRLGYLHWLSKGD